jgi:uncharacterized PurR-regulated membrane protein YhhQ (DUF165 family)
MGGRRIIGGAAFVMFAACIPLANWFINNVGDPTFPGGPHTIPVGFGYDAPSGVLWIGVALVARDVVHRLLGWPWALVAIAFGTGLSALFADPSLVTASAVAFCLGELADMGVYTPLYRRHLYLAVILSGVVGAVLDSLIFLQIAFDSTDFWQGNTLGKVWMTLAALPLIGVLRRAVPDHAVDPAGA